MWIQFFKVFGSTQLVCRIQYKTNCFTFSYTVFSSWIWAWPNSCYQPIRVCGFLSSLTYLRFYQWTVLRSLGQRGKIDMGLTHPLCPPRPCHCKVIFSLSLPCMYLLGAQSITGQLEPAVQGFRKISLSIVSGFWEGSSLRRKIPLLLEGNESLPDQYLCSVANHLVNVACNQTCERIEQKLPSEVNFFSPTICTWTFQPHF